MIDNNMYTKCIELQAVIIVLQFPPIACVLRSSLSVEQEVYYCLITAAAAAAAGGFDTG
jgi:hypothetical protein